jgi:hypothetical protein
MPRRVDQERQCKHIDLAGRRCGKFHGHMGFHEAFPGYDLPLHSNRARQQRIKHGVRLFRLKKPDGEVFCVRAVNLERGTAYGNRAKRKTMIEVRLYELFPNTVKQ